MRKIGAGLLAAAAPDILHGLNGNLGTKVVDAQDETGRDLESIPGNVIDLSNPAYWEESVHNGEVVRILYLEKTPIFDRDRALLVNDSETPVILDFSAIEEEKIRVASIGKTLKVENIGIGDTQYLHDDVDNVAFPLKGNFEIRGGNRTLSAYNPIRDNFATRVFQLFGSAENPTKLKISDLTITDLPWMNVRLNDVEPGRSEHAVAIQPAGVGVENGDLEMDNVEIAIGSESRIVHSTGITTEEVVALQADRFGSGSGEVKFTSGVVIINVPRYESGRNDVPLIVETHSVFESRQKLKLNNCSIYVPWDGLAVQAMFLDAQVHLTNIRQLSGLYANTEGLDSIEFDRSLPDPTRGAGIGFSRSFGCDLELVGVNIFANKNIIMLPPNQDRDPNVFGEGDFYNEVAALSGQTGENKVTIYGNNELGTLMYFLDCKLGKVRFIKIYDEDSLNVETFGQGGNVFSMAETNDGSEYIDLINSGNVNSGNYDFHYWNHSRSSVVEIKTSLNITLPQEFNLNDKNIEFLRASTDIATGGIENMFANGSLSVKQRAESGDVLIRRFDNEVWLGIVANLPKDKSYDVYLRLVNNKLHAYFIVRGATEKYLYKET